MKTLKEELALLTMECQYDEGCVIYKTTHQCPTYCVVDTLQTVRHWLIQKQKKVTQLHLYNKESAQNELLNELLEELE